MTFFPRQNWTGFALVFFFPWFALLTLVEKRVAPGALLPFFLISLAVGAGLVLLVLFRPAVRKRSSGGGGEALIQWLRVHRRAAAVLTCVAAAGIAGGLLVTAGRYDGGYLLFRCYSQAVLLLGCGLVNDWLLLQREE